MTPRPGQGSAKGSVNVTAMRCERRNKDRTARRSAEVAADLVFPLLHHLRHCATKRKIVLKSPRRGRATPSVLVLLCCSPFCLISFDRPWHSRFLRRALHRPSLPRALGLGTPSARSHSNSGRSLGNKRKKVEYLGLCQPAPLDHSVTQSATTHT
ncbi:hypothetical protein VTJ49DRAFT_5697 [Mycothermus thermophilus]|uniref:Uncharacterized protein n=1 Tax=Humicola insolens TaxID=85995 RepID=A0ABR3V327_HUMIN